MKTGKSSLNPHAASYIPLSQKSGSVANKDYKLTDLDCKSGNGGEWEGSPFVGEQIGDHQNVADVNDTLLNIGKGSTPEENNIYHDIRVSSSQHANEIPENLILEKDIEMDLAYLQMIFPGISDESLSGIYFASNGDLEASIDMLDQLEFSLPEKLPETLDIGDLSEAGHSSKVASKKLNKVPGVEVADPSSSSSTSALVT